MKPLLFLGRLIAFLPPFIYHGNMKRLLIFFIVSIVLFFKFIPPAVAQSPTPFPTAQPIICGCPDVLQNSIYSSTTREDGSGRCVYDMQTFQQDPAKNHLWVEDPEITAQGKADERARQFLFWVFNTGTVDTHPALIKVWNLAKNISFFLLLIVVAVMGLGLIVGQRAHFATGIKIGPLIIKLLILILYVIFSATLIITLIQLSDVLMKFFIEKVGGRDLFNINFGVLSGEESYIKFVGCRDLNIRVQEGVRAELTMLKVTNLTYYVMGVMLILRKVILWFFLFLSPFLALLLPFVFIRNTGWIWIGVFFQWLFYGPLFALFLGGVATTWQLGIPFIFDFSRVESNASKCNPAGYIYPTAINILYGGPAQKLAPCNNGNYVDTFAEYIISLVMLWAVTFFPWWLLRIFRDYCCEGILAMKNILLSMYDQMRGGLPPSAPGPVPVPAPSGLVTGTALKLPKDETTPTVTRLETIEDIKKTRTEDITRTLQISATHLTDIARFETNKQQQEIVTKNINYLQNPMKAETPTERQKYMNIRSELFNRAIKEDKTAKQVLSSLSTSRIEQFQKREELIKSISQPVPVTHIVSVKVKIPQDKVQSTTSSFFNTVSQNSQFVTNIAQNTKLQTTQVKSVLNSLAQNINQPTTTISSAVSQQTGVEKQQVNTILTSVAKNINQAPTDFSASISQQTGVEKRQVEVILTSLAQNINQAPIAVSDRIVKQTGIEKEKVTRVVNAFYQTVKENKVLIKQVAEKENIKEEQVEKILTSQLPVIAQPQKHIEETISIPPSVSLDEYEQVKKMWKDQYERGEVPISDKIKSRDQWIGQDVVFITNTLNKLVSDAIELRQEGLDEVGYILPIFLINNLKGDELLVYLKAKLEAAKEIQTILEQKEEAKKEVEEEKVEELVDVDKPQAEEKEKEMEMKEELENKEVENTQPGEKKENSTGN